MACEVTRCFSLARSLGMMQGQALRCEIGSRRRDFPVFPLRPKKPAFATVSGSSPDRRSGGGRWASRVNVETFWRHRMSSFKAEVKLGLQDAICAFSGA